MKTVRRIALAIALALIFAPGVNAQDETNSLSRLWMPGGESQSETVPACRVKVRIAAFNWNNAEEIRTDFMSSDQTEWWVKEGQKKFPKICLTQEDGQADYVIAWTGTETSETYHYTVPKTSTTQHSGTVYGPGGVGGYSGTSTTTTNESKQGEWPVTFVNAFVYKMSGTPGEKIPPPLFIAKHKGQWRWSKPDKDAFVKAMEFINKQLK